MRGTRFVGIGIPRADQWQDEAESSSGHSRAPRHTSVPTSGSVLDRLQSRQLPDAHPTSSRAGRTALPAVAPNSLSDLPTEVLRDIANRLNAQAAHALASTSKAVLTSTRAVVAKAQLLARLESFDGDGTVRDVLTHAARIPEAEAAARGEVLRAIAQKIDVSGEQAAELVKEFLHTIAPLKQAQQADALEALISGAEQHPPAGVALVQTLLQAIDDLERKHRAAPLAPLARWLSGLPEQDQPAAFALVQESIERLGGHPAAAQSLTALAGALFSLPAHAAVQQPLFDFLAREIERLPQPARGAPLAALAKLVHQALPDTDSRLNRVTDAIKELAPEHAVDALASLALQVKHFPANRIETVFNDFVMPSMEQLPTALLAEFVQRLQQLQVADDPQHPLLMAAVLRAIDRLPDARVARALPKLVSQLGDLPQGEALEQSWHSAMRLTAKVSPRDRAGLLAGLAKQIQRLTESLRQEALERTLTGLMALPTNLHGNALQDQARALTEVFNSKSWASLADEAIHRYLWAALSMLSQLPPTHFEPLHAVAAHLPIERLEPDARTEAIMQLLEHAERVPIDKAEQPLTALISLLGKASEPTALKQGFSRLLGIMLRLPENAPAPGLELLSQQFHALPQGVELDIAWKQMRSLAERVPPNSLRLGPIAANLATAVAQLEQPRTAWKEMEALAERLSQDRTLASVVERLAQAVPRLAPRMQSDAIAWLLRTADQVLVSTDLRRRDDALVKLAEVIPDMAKEARYDAFEGVMRHLSKLSHGNTSVARLVRQLALCAAHLPRLALRRAAVNDVLFLIGGIRDMRSRGEALAALARDSLPRALEPSVPVLPRLARRRVDRASLLQRFRLGVETLPAHVRVPALEQMIQNANLSANQHAGPSTSREMSARLLPMLQSLLEQALDQRETVPGQQRRHDVDQD